MAGDGTWECPSGRVVGGVDVTISSRANGGVKWFRTLGEFSYYVVNARETARHSKHSTLTDIRISRKSLALQRVLVI